MEPALLIIGIILIFFSYTKSRFNYKLLFIGLLALAIGYFEFHTEIISNKVLMLLIVAVLINFSYNFKTKRLNYKWFAFSLIVGAKLLDYLSLKYFILAVLIWLLIDFERKRIAIEYIPMSAFIGGIYFYREKAQELISTMALKLLPNTQHPLDTGLIIIIIALFILDGVIKKWT